MSVNQSKGDKNEPSQYRRPGRSGNPASQRNYSGGASGGKGGGGGSTTAPPSSSSYSGKSFKKVVSNAQGPQTRVPGVNPNVNLGSLNASTVGRAAQNGAHIQPPLKGTPDASPTDATAKSIDASVQKSNPGLPKAPQSNVVPSGSGSTGPATPAKGPADASRAFPLQFGSISPGVMNGMQVPARTNSAPPNLDEQKRVQARLDSLKAAPYQNPIPKQHVPRKDGGGVDQANASGNEVHSTQKEKRDVLSSTAPVAAHVQKPSGPPPPMPSIPMQMPFHQSQLHLQFGGPNPPPFQSQGMVNTSLPVPLPMHLPVGNPSQQVFVPGIQHHPMSSQGILHQSQGLTFSSQMGPQMGLGPQYQQQQMGNYGGTRRTVKITHPDTHEELTLDKRNDVYPNGGSSGQRSNPHGPPQSSFPAAHPMNYYPTSYSPSPMFFPPPGSQTASGSQPPRFYNQHASKQVTIKPAVTAHVEKVGDLPAMEKTEIPKVQKAGGEGNSGHPLKDSEVIAGTSLPPPTAAPMVSSSKPSGSSAAIDDSFKEETKQPDKKSVSISRVEEISNPSIPFSGTNKDELEISNKVVAGDVSGPDSNKEGEVIGSGTHSDMSPKVEGEVSEVIESKEQNQDSTGSLNAELKEPVNNSAEVDALSAETSSPNLGSTHVEKISVLDGNDTDHVDSKESVSVSVPESTPLTLEVEVASATVTGAISPSSSGPMVETGKGKASTPKGKKKIKEILKNADARGTTSDLYNAYKRPEEKKEPETSSDITTTKQTSVDLSEKDEKHGQVKIEPDDWEDAADNSTPKLETSDLKHNSEDDNDGMTKKYSRDFLLKFSEHCTDLPEGFEVTTDIAEALIGSSVGPHPSPGRGVDRSAVGPRVDQWSKGRDMRLDMGYPGNAGNFRSGNHGVLRTPRPQTPGQYGGGILSGPMQSPGPQRNTSDSDRWQRASGYQKGLMPSPQTPMMHKAERKYEVGKITDEEQAKQRQLKGILNKLTPQNFEKLFEQVKQVNIDNAGTLSGVIDQIFDKALMEPTFVEMYANFCSRLSVELPDFSEDNEKITFKRLLLNKCQEEFERGEREQEEANCTEEEGEVKQTEEQREEKRVKARRRMLGNIRLIGELYKKKMLTERIMHDCIMKLLGEYQNPDEENIESLCKLMSTIGEMIDHAKAKEHMDVYFDRMFNLSNNMKLSSRVRFMLKDVIDLRKNRWQQRRKVEGPKKIEEVHRDAAQERQAQSSRLARGPNPNPNPSHRRGQGQPNVLPMNQQMGGFRGQQQLRGYGNQDSRFEERHSFENRPLSVPLRPVGDDSITLGPQGGLARGMRGQPLMQSMPLHDSRRPVAGPNGYGSGSGSGYGPGPGSDLASRYTPERAAPRPAFDQSNTGRAPPPQGRVVTSPQSGSSDKVLSEDRLHDLSMEAIKEFYSARDEKEVALCIKELNAPTFYPSMISIWVTDSFERKDMERDSLAKLLINLTKSQDGMLNQDSLVRGFESVLSTLEDAVNDAPKAGEFLGRMFARMVMENVMPYKEVSRLIYEGGEEQGRLVEIGLAAEVLGVILEMIKSEKGDPFLNDLLAASSIRLENFRSPSIKKASRLDKFI